MFFPQINCRAMQLGLRELCSKSSSLFYSEFPQKLYHYAYYYAQNLLIILIILNLTGEFLQLFSLLQSKTSKTFYSLCVLLSETVTA